MFTPVNALQPGVALTATSPTRGRYNVVALGVTFGMVTYLDRVCISKMAPNIMADLSLSKVQMGCVFSSFALSYALFALPMARWADRVGVRILLTLIVSLWSIFTIGTAITRGFISLIVVRFLFGAGESGAWPCITKSFARWIPCEERGRVQGVFFTGAHLTGGLTPLLVVWLSDFMSWRSIFVVFGLIGFVWSVIWYSCYQDSPAKHGRVNQAELELINAGREKETDPEPSGRAYWVKLLKSRNVLALCVMYFPNSFVFYFCITWLPTYLKEQYNFTGATLGFFAGLPLLLSIFGDLCGGILTDRVTARFGLRMGRCGVGALFYLIAGLGLLAVPSCANAILAAILIAAAVAASMCALAAAWSTCIDISGNSAATVSATMNTSGQIGSFFCPLIVAYCLKCFGNQWNIPICLMGFLFLVGTVCWLVIDPRKPVFGQNSNL